jgi:hypothetical protein
MPENSFNNPVFPTRDWLAFYNLHRIANLAAQLIMSHYMMATMNNFLIQAMAICAADFYNHSLLHLIAGYDACNATTIIHA